MLIGLFFTFAKIGLFTFGGGYAMISVIENICVEQKKWISHEDMMNVAVIAESTPGPIAINCATFVGYLRGGFSGAVAATIGVVTPSFLIIYLISMFLDRFLEITAVASAFQGIKLAVGILILNAGWNMFRKMKKTPLSVGILLVASAVMLLVNIFSLRISTIVLMLGAGILSLLLSFTSRKGGQS